MPLSGGLSGLIPFPLIAGAVEPGAAVLAATLYFWQLPHFLSLAWLCREDYMRGKYAMLPRFDASGRRTAACALRNSLYMLPIGAFAVWVSMMPNPRTTVCMVITFCTHLHLQNRLEIPGL